MNSFSFEYPYIFLLILLFIVCNIFCKIKNQAIIFPHIDILVASRDRKFSVTKILKWMTIILSITALASPVIENKIEIEKRDGYAITLALDASGSMSYGFDKKLIGYGVDVENKFDVSIQMAQDFIKKRVNDQIGVVVFGDFAYVATPLTYDKYSIKKILDGLSVGIAGSTYTVINDALFTSSKLFKNSNVKTKIIILLTDGISRGDNVPFDVALRLTQQYNIKVYTIGIGKSGEFNEKHLDLIAKRSKGEFFTAENKETLKKVYEMIDELEKSEIKSQKYIKKSYLFEYPLFLAFISLLFYIFIVNKRGIF